MLVYAIVLKYFYWQISSQNAKYFREILVEGLSYCKVARKVA